MTGGLSYLLGEILGRFTKISVPIYFGAVWMGMISISLTIFIFEFIFSAIFPVHRELFTKVSIVIVIILTISGLLNSAFFRRIKRITLTYDSLPGILNGFKIIHLSDLHLGKLTTINWFKKIVDEVNLLNPDLIVITGDLIDEDIGASKEYCSELSRLSASFGVYAVPGNHEYYAGIDEFINITKQAGIKVLINSSAKIKDSICLIGLTDISATRTNNAGPDLEKAFADVSDEKLFKIILVHQPIFFNESVEKGIKLQLSGHTHSGQLIPINFLVKFLYKYSYGLFSKNGAFIYTTCGTGTWGPPLRLGSRSEIIQITFRVPASVICPGLRKVHDKLVK